MSSNKLRLFCRLNKCSLFSNKLWHKINYAYSVDRISVVYLMHNEKAAVTNCVTSQFYSNSRYKNLKWKILKCNSNIYFKKQCVNKRLIPKYARNKFPNTSPATKFTNTKAQKLRMVLCSVE
jgi:hypothetical protein